MTACKVCGKRVGKRGITLYATPSGPAKVCGARCLDVYAGGKCNPHDCVLNAREFPR